MNAGERHGRPSYSIDFNFGNPFQATREPDGQLSHWLKVEGELQAAAGVRPGDRVDFEIAAVAEEPGPEVPEDFQKALAGSPEAR